VNVIDTITNPDAKLIAEALNHAAQGGELPAFGTVDRDRLYEAVRTIAHMEPGTEHFQLGFAALSVVQHLLYAQTQAVIAASRAARR
jgi:hypothetical protein